MLSTAKRQAEKPYSIADIKCRDDADVAASSLLLEQLFYDAAVWLGVNGLVT